MHIIDFPLELWLTYFATVLIFMITPGPSHLLMLSNSLKYGLKNSKPTIFGDLSANAIQMIIASAGLASLIRSSISFFVIVKWMGVAYLIFLGSKQILGTKINPEKDSVKAKNSRQFYYQGFITSASNPKAIIFFAALFPQFLNVDQPIFFQLLVLGTTYILIDGAFLFSYGVFADWIKSKMNIRIKKKLDQISGSFLIIAAILLGLKDMDA